MINTDDCLLYAGIVNPRGYGILGDWSVHTVVYESEAAPLAEGLELDHLCGVKSCININHLEPVTHKENMRRWRGNREGYCKRGHKLTSENTYVWKFKGRNVPQRRCKTCSSMTARIRYLKLKEKP